MIEPSEITSQKTDVPTTTGITSNTVASSVRAKSGRIIKNPKGEMEKFGGIWRNVEQLVEYLLNEQTELFYKQTNKQTNKNVQHLFLTQSQ